MNWSGLKKKYTIAVIAHQGNNKQYPGNTLLAFEKAIEAGADYIELDIHLTKDEQIAVIHNGTTEEVSDMNLTVRDATLKELQRVKLEENQKIPSLEEVFKLCKGKIGVQIEIKSPHIAPYLVNLISQYGMEEEVMLSSFAHSEIVAVKKINSALACATLEFLQKPSKKLADRMIKHAQKVEAQAIHPEGENCTKELCEKAHAAKFLVIPWTVDDPEEWHKMMDMGVDGIITNDPQGLVAYLKAKL